MLPVRSYQLPLAQQLQPTDDLVQFASLVLQDRSTGDAFVTVGHHPSVHDR